MTTPTIITMRQWCQTVGDAKVADLLGVSKHHALKLRLGYRLPSPELADKVVAASHGLVTYEGIFGPENRRSA